MTTNSSAKKKIASQSKDIFEWIGEGDINDGQLQYK
jgi:hypothetical protein